MFEDLEERFNSKEGRESDGEGRKRKEEEIDF